MNYDTKLLNPNQSRSCEDKYSVVISWIIYLMLPPSICFSILRTYIYHLVTFSPYITYNNGLLHTKVL